MRLSAVFLIAAAAASGCTAGAHPQVMPVRPAAPGAIEMIGELKAFEESLGGAQTENFLVYSGRLRADERCYFTGKLQLPEFYSGLRLAREDEGRCTARADESDVFFYPVEAVASGQETVTVSLAEASVERVLVVVPHEDFHNQAEALKAPTEVAEAAATLVGFLTASDFAKERFGEESATYRSLDLESELFLLKSAIVNAYYNRLSDIYKAFRAGMITQEQTLQKKADLFAELKQSCSAISPDPVSFNKCPSAMNNAGLAFDRTYTSNYPILHDLYTLLGGDTSALVVTLKRLLTNWPGSAAGAADLVKSSSE